MTDLERPAVRRLACGSTLYVLERPEHPLAILQAALKCGSVSEAAEPGYGLAHFTEHMLFNGCAGFPGTAVSRILRKAGGECNASTGFDVTRYWMELPAADVGLAVQLLAAMVTSPTFPEASCRKERTVILREAEMYRDQPDSVVAQGLWELLFPDHPARFPIAGLPERIVRITRAQALAFHHRFYTPDQAIWVAAGRVDPDRLAAALDRMLTGWKCGSGASLPLPTLPVQGLPQRREATFADPLARIAIGFRLPAMPSPELPALDLLSGLLAESESSRMVRELQQRRNLAVSLGSSGYAGHFGGELGLTATCRPADLEALEAGIRNILEEFRTGGVTQEELQREKLQQELGFRQSWQSARDAVFHLASGICHCGSVEAWHAYRKRLQAVTVDEINAVMAEYLKEERLAAMLLRPASPENTPKKPKKAAIAVPKTLLDSGKTAEGIRYFSIVSDRSGLQDLKVLLPLGSMDETPETNGSAALLAELLETGPATLPETRFHEQMDNAGIELSARAGKYFLSLSLNFPQEAAATAETMLTELLLHPRLTAAAVNRERASLAATLTGYAADPFYAASGRMLTMLFGDHPAARPRLGTPESVSRLTVKMLQSRCVSAWQPDRLFFGAALPDDPKLRKARIAFFRTLSKRLRHSHQPQKPFRRPPLPSPQKSGYAGITLPKEQAMVLCGLRGPSTAAPLAERMSLSILQQALNGLDSPLFRAIREKRSLAYATGLIQAVYLSHGTIYFYAGTAPERAAEAAQEIARMLRRLRQKGLTKGEFAAAKIALAGADARRKESAGITLSALLTAAACDLPVAEVLEQETLLEKLDFTTANAAIRRLCQAPLCTVIAAPRPPNSLQITTE